MGDINLNGNSDGVRMTWPRAAVLAIALAVAGGTWARVEMRLSSVQDQQDRTSAQLEQLNKTVSQIRDAYLLSQVPPPRVDEQGRILK